MSDIPCIAVVIEGGVVQTILIERWPDQFPLPRVVVVDYDKEGADESELTSFAVGNEIEEALCHVKVPTVYESADRPVLSPCVVLVALEKSGPSDA